MDTFIEFLQNQSGHVNEEEAEGGSCGNGGGCGCSH
jgi:hypothetical protein